MGVLKKADGVISLMLRIICLAAFLGLFIILLMNVFFRWVPLLSYLPGFSMGWFDEIVEMLFAWMVLSGSSLLCRGKDHFKVDLIQMKIQGKRSLYILEFFINLATLAFFLLLLYYGWKLVLGGVQTTPVLKLQKRWLYLCIPFNALIMSGYTFRDAVENGIKIIGYKK